MTIPHKTQLCSFFYFFFFYFNGKYWKENTSSFPIVIIWKKTPTNQENKQQKDLPYQATAHIFEIPYTCLKNLFS